RAGSTPRPRCSGPSSASRSHGGSGSRSRTRLGFSDSHARRASGASVQRTLERGMRQRFSYSTVRETPRRVIHVVHAHDMALEPHTVDDITARMQERLASRGELNADVVVVQGGGKTTFRMYGLPYSVSRVRAAMFNAAISWTSIELD